MSEPQQFRRRQIFVYAMQLTAESTPDLIRWLPSTRYLITDEAGMPALWVHTPEGRKRVRLNDWVVHEYFGFRVYSPSAFEELFGPDLIAEPTPIGYDEEIG